MSYKITVTPLDNHAQFKYSANTHPLVGEMLYYRDRRYKVVEAGHLLTTSFDGNKETSELTEVELIVTLQ